MSLLLLEKGAKHALSHKADPEHRRPHRWPWLALTLVTVGVVLRLTLHKSLVWLLGALLGLAGLHLHSPLHTSRTVGLDQLVRIGIEKHNVQLRGNPLDYGFSVHQTVYIKTPWGWTSAISKDLHHKTVTLIGTGGVVRKINPEATKFVAVVNDQHRSIMLSLPEPSIDPRSVSITQVNGTKVNQGIVDAVIGNQFSAIKSLLGLSDQLNLTRLSAEAKSQMLAKTSTDSRLLQSSEHDIQSALGAFITNTPAYHGYRLSVTWEPTRNT